MAVNREMLEFFGKAPPRDVKKAGSFFTQNNGLIKSFLIAGPCGFVVMMLLLYRYDGLSRLTGELLVSLGFALFIELFAVAFIATKRSLMTLAAEGTLFTGKVTGITAPPDKSGNAYIFITVEFVDETGTSRTARATTLGNVSNIDVKPADQIQVLYLPGQSRIAVYTDALGMVTGALVKTKEGLPGA